MSPFFAGIDDSVYGHFDRGLFPNFTPVVPKYTEWVNFAKAAYSELVYGAMGDQNRVNLAD